MTGRPGLISQVRAELLLRRGDVEAGLQAFDGCLETSLAWGFLDAVLRRARAVDR